MTRARGAVTDIFIAISFAAIAYFVIFQFADWPRDHYWWAARDVWFDSDSDRVFFVEAVHTWGYDRAAIHPLHAYLSRPVISFLRWSSGFDQDLAVRHFHTGIGALWVGGFFLLLRRFRCRRLDASLFTVAASTSAAALFWLPSIETFALGSLSTFPALALAARGTAAPAWKYGAAVLAGLSVTITNAGAGVVAAAASLRLKKAALAVGAAAAVVGILAAAHSRVFWGSSLMPAGEGSELAWVFAPEAGGAWAITRAFFFTSVVAPEIGFFPNWRHPLWPVMSFQLSGLATGTALSLPATVVWAGLLAAGGMALLRMKENGPLRLVLGGTLLLQWMIHLFYGRETFLYSLHFVPMLMAAAALATRTRFRPVVLALVVILIATNLPNNARLWTWARAYASRAKTLKEVKPNLGLWGIESEVPSDESGAYRFWR